MRMTIFRRMVFLTFIFLESIKRILEVFFTLPFCINSQSPFDLPMIPGMEKKFSHGENVVNMLKVGEDRKNRFRAFISSIYHSKSFRMSV